MPSQNGLDSPAALSPWLINNQLADRMGQSDDLCLQMIFDEHSSGLLTLKRAVDVTVRVWGSMCGRSCRLCDSVPGLQTVYIITPYITSRTGTESVLSTP